MNSVHPTPLLVACASKYLERCPDGWFFPCGSCPAVQIILLLCNRYHVVEYMSNRVQLLHRGRQCRHMCIMCVACRT